VRQKRVAKIEFCQNPTIRGKFLRTQELILWVNCLSNMIFSFSYLISSSFIFIHSWNTKKFKIFIIFKRKFFNLNMDLPKSKHWLCYACFENILLKTGFCLNRGNNNNNNNNLLFNSDVHLVLQIVLILSEILTYINKMESPQSKHFSIILAIGAAGTAQIGC
jgi:hypothetical protein